MNPDFLALTSADTGPAPWWIWLIGTVAFILLATFIVCVIWEPDSGGEFFGCLAVAAFIAFGVTGIVAAKWGGDATPEVDFAASAEQLVEAVDEEYGLEIGMGTANTLLEGIEASILDRQGEVVTFGSVELLYAGEVTEVTLAWYSDAWVLLDDAGDPLIAAETAEGWD